MTTHCLRRWSCAERHGVELGVRQQRWSVPLETEPAQGLIVPTAEETFRIKAYLVYRRRAVRDYLDVAALADVVGRERALNSLKWLNVLYEGEGNQSAATKFADAVQQDPRDLDRVDLASYRGIVPPYSNWEYVARRCREIGEALFLLEMEGGLPTQSEDFIAQDRSEERAEHADAQQYQGHGGRS